MLAGREYGRGSSDCQNCERHSISLVHVECYSCGRQGCDACLTLQTDAPDSDTGYRDERYVCQSCACIGNDPLCPCQDGDPLTGVRDMCHYRGPDAWRAEALARCADLRESLRQAEGGEFE